MGNQDFLDASWCATLRRLHEEMLKENDFMNEVTQYHILSDEDIELMGEEHENHKQIPATASGSGCDQE